MTLTCYGIANCDTVKKARAWLSAQGVAHDFVDFKKTPPTAELLQSALQALPWSSFLNRSGTSWRKLSPAEQAMVLDAASTIAAALANPSLIKRPLVQWPDGRWTQGFKAEDWERQVVETVRR
jgi:arsenate reductase (glutaredoxin)